MTPQNKKYEKVNYLKDQLEKQGWSIEEEEYTFTDVVVFDTVLMAWSLQRNRSVDPIIIEFTANQIGNSTLADKNDFFYFNICDSGEIFYFPRKQNEWKDEDEVCLVLKSLNEIEKKEALRPLAPIFFTNFLLVGEGFKSNLKQGKITELNHND